MKKQQSVIGHTPLQKCNYDTLLEELLPAIHKAAQSLPNEQHNGQHIKDISKDLHLAGLRGFKEMFLQLNDRSHHGEPREILLQAIHHSMQEQISINTHQ